eukprot:gene41750-51710_t
MDTVETDTVAIADEKAVDSVEPEKKEEKDDSGDDSSLFVSNLTRNVTKEHLEEIFGSYGEVRIVKVNSKESRPNQLGRIEGSIALSKTLTAIVTFQRDRDAEQALINMDGGQIDGNLIKVSFVLVSNNKRDNDQIDKKLGLSKGLQTRKLIVSGKSRMQRKLFAVKIESIRTENEILIWFL